MTDRTYEFELPTGRSIRLQALDQHWTYGGLLAGHPHGEMNRRIMDRLVARHSDPRDPGAVVLLEPVPVRLEIPSSRAEDDPPAALPVVTCVARFLSERLAGDPGGFASVLRVIWFQDEFAFPIDPLVAVELTALDWEGRAAAWEP